MKKNPIRSLFVLLLVLFVYGCAPVADNLTLTTEENTPLEFVLTGTLPDDSGTPASKFSIVTGPSFGKLTGLAPNLTYTPLPGFIGKDQITFVAMNGVVASEEATISINVAPNMDTLADKPAPVFMRLGYATSNTSINVDWTASSDNDTLAENLLYEVHLSEQEAFFPSEETLYTTISNAVSTEIEGLTPNSKVYVQVIAVDGSGNRSLETTALPITLPAEALVTREDVGIFMADGELSNPELDPEGQTLRFQRVTENLPEAGDFIVLNANDDAAIFKINQIAEATPAQVTFKVASADFGDLFTAGSLNFAMATSSGKDTGWRWGDWDWLKSYDYPWKESISFDCADDFGSNTRIPLIDYLPTGMVHADAGVELGCNMTVEASIRYGINTSIPDINACLVENPPDLYVAKDGHVAVKGNFSVKPYMNAGYSIPLTLAKANIWKAKQPIERKVKIKLKIKGVPVVIPVSIQVWPKLDWNLKIAAGQNVDFVTEAQITASMDSVLHFKRKVEIIDNRCVPDMLGYEFEFENINPPSLMPETGAAILKAQEATEARIENNFLAGVGINLMHLERLSITTGLNVGVNLEGEVKDRQNDMLLADPVNASPQEVHKLELNVQPSLRATASVKAFELDMPWYVKMVVEPLYTFKWELADIPMFEPIPLASNAHLDLNYAEGSDLKFTLTGTDRTSPLIPGGIIESETEWFNLIFEDEYTLTPGAPSQSPTAEGVWKSDAKNMVVALKYLPKIAEPLLGDYPDYVDMMTKYAMYEMQDCSPLIMGRYVIKSTGPGPEKDCAVVKDVVTNLEWQRCSAGQTWDNDQKACLGVPWRRYRPQHKMVVDYGVPSFLEDVPDGWRLPTISELRSLVYCSSGIPVSIGMTLDDTQCGSGSTLPTIVAEAFPNTPIYPHGGYWSTTPNISTSVPDFWWVTRFDLGVVNGGGYNLMYHMRYVRDAQ